MSQALVEVTLDLAEQLEEAVLKQASYEENISILKTQNEDLCRELAKVKSELSLQKKASDSFNAGMLSATTSLEQVGFLAPGTAVKAYQTLINDNGEIPVLLEKLANTLNQNFNDGTVFNETASIVKQAGETNPWLALVDENFRIGS